MSETETQSVTQKVRAIYLQDGTELIVTLVDEDEQYLWVKNPYKVIYYPSDGALSLTISSFMTYTEKDELFPIKSSSVIIYKSVDSSMETTYKEMVELDFQETTEEDMDLLESFLSKSTGQLH